MDKLGPYIQKLMTTVLDNKEDDFVKELAMSELTRLKVNINDINKAIEKFLFVNLTH